jgi:prefoldin subunit 5
MRSTKNTLERMRQRLQRVERRQSLQRVLDAIETRRMSVDEKIKLLERIANDCMAGVITPAEANKMTKTVKIS